MTAHFHPPWSHRTFNQQAEQQAELGPSARSSQNGDNFGHNKLSSSTHSVTLRGLIECVFCNGVKCIPLPRGSLGDEGLVGNKDSSQVRVAKRYFR